MITLIDSPHPCMRLNLDFSITSFRTQIPVLHYLGSYTWTSYPWRTYWGFSFKTEWELLHQLSHLGSNGTTKLSLGLGLGPILSLIGHYELIECLSIFELLGDVMGINAMVHLLKANLRSNSLVNQLSYLLLFTIFSLQIADILRTQELQVSCTMKQITMYNREDGRSERFGT